MKVTITPFHFEELIKKGYSLDIIYLLKTIEQQYDIRGMCEGSAKIDALYKSLIRKGLITETDDKITTIGTELLQFLETKDGAKLIKRKPASDEFTEWWNAFPGTDIFEYKGKKFTGGRALKTDKDNCRLKFDKILIEGEYTARQLIDALKYEVIQKKEASVKEGKNTLKYMHNSLTYLNQRDFEPFIELISEGVKITETEIIRGGTDI